MNRNLVLSTQADISKAQSPSPWLIDVQILTKDYNDDSNDVLQHPAAYQQDAEFLLLDTSTYIQAYLPAWDLASRADEPLYLPCHSDCLRMTKRAISSVVSVANEQEGLHHVWLVLRHLFDMHGQKCTVSQECVPAFEYYGVTRFRDQGWIHQCTDTNGKMHGAEVRLNAPPQYSHQAENI